MMDLMIPAGSAVTVASRFTMRNVALYGGIALGAVALGLGARAVYKRVKAKQRNEAKNKTKAKAKNKKRSRSRQQPKVLASKQRVPASRQTVEVKATRTKNGVKVRKAANE